MGVAANEALSPASLSAMRLGMQIKSLVAKTNPKILILTHEGFAWERMAFYFAKQENDGDFIICGTTASYGNGEFDDVNEEFDDRNDSNSWDYQDNNHSHPLEFSWVGTFEEIDNQIYKLIMCVGS